MGLFRNRPLIGVEVALHPPHRAAVRLVVPDGHSPESRDHDRLVLACGMVACAVREAPPSRERGVRSCLIELAQGVAAPGDGPLPLALVYLGPLGIAEFLQVIPWDGPGRGIVAAEVLAARDGRFTPRVPTTPAFAGPTVEVAALAVVAHLAAEGGRPDRLALALAIEGVLDWYGQADGRSEARDATTWALAHVAERLAEAGLPAPTSRA